MHRQSVGSPASRIQSHGGKEVMAEEREKGDEILGDECEKTEKLLKFASRAERSIHIIPILTIFCLLVLYLVSCDPSPRDLETIGDFRGFSRGNDLSKIDEFKQDSGPQNSKIAAFRSNHRSLQEIKNPTTYLVL